MHGSLKIVLENHDNDDDNGDDDNDDDDDDDDNDDKERNWKMILQARDNEN